MSKAAIFLAVLASFATARAADAQTTFDASRDQPTLTFPQTTTWLGQTPFLAGVPPINVFNQAPTTSAAMSWTAEGRACEGCPHRSVGRAFADATIINGFYWFANVLRGEETAKVTPSTWWANMQQGWVWDLNPFKVNQIGHPYQGNNYFNAGRANGLSFWESAGLAAFGSATWEYYGETNYASFNDVINTTLGGIALGEMFHRAAWLVRNPETSGSGRLWSEIAATAIDPVTGVRRFLSDDSSRISEKPPDMVPTHLSGLASAGMLWRGSNTNAFEASPDPFLELDLLYGDPTTGQSRVPYDAFAVLLRFGGGSGFTEAKVRGRLFAQPTAHKHIQLSIMQAYDFNENNVYKFGAQSFNVNVAFANSVASHWSLWASGAGGLTALGAIDSIPLGGKPPEAEGGSDNSNEGPRYYDYGPGFNFAATAILRHDGHPIVSTIYQGNHLYSLDGVRANHILQQLRVDLIAPLHGALGVGVSGEYFDRHTFFQDVDHTIQHFHYPQARIYLTWRVQ